ncbi:hypothetical protein JW899_00440 [Candidatus Uhrbacteria bacterium]|nr:hypothetical protein [Candidatus Uhrbacteria bacterium]
MKNKMMRLASRLTATAMVLSMFASVVPAMAADLGLESAKDTLTRQKALTYADHTLVFTTADSADVYLDGSDDWATGETITFDYNTAGFDLAASTTWPVQFSGTGTVQSTATTSSNSLTVTCTTGPCYGTVTVSFSGTNPSAGSHDIIVGGTSEFGTSTPSDMFSIVIVDSDQVTINASISSSMTFDLDTSLADAETSTPYAVEFGTLTSSDIRSSGDTVDGDTNYIWIDLAHNGTGGAVVTVSSRNHNLTSYSSSDEIASTSGAYSAGAENYGLCIESTTSTAGTFVAHADFGSGSAGDNSAACSSSAFTDMGSLDGPGYLLNTGTGALTGGRAKLVLAATISATTPANPDYFDTLTFTATATY